MTDNQYPVNFSRLPDNSAIAERPVNIFDPSIPEDRHEFVLDKKRLTGVADLFNQRVNDRPYLRPAIHSPLAKSGRMLPVVTQARAVCVIIKLDHLTAPPEEHGKIRSQNDTYSSAETLRPSFEWADRSFAPIVSACQSPHFASAFQIRMSGRFSNKDHK